MAKKTTKSALKKQAEEILAIAEKQGVEQNYFFVTTFNRYMTQLSILEGLEKHIKKDGFLVEKEYVKGRKNVYTNPAIADYNKTGTAANQTVVTLIKILKNLKNGGEDDENGRDELLEILGIKK